MTKIADILHPLLRPLWIIQAFYIVCIGVLLFRFHGSVLDMWAVDERDITHFFSPLSSWIMACVFFVVHASAAVLIRQTIRPIPLIFATINALSLLFFSAIWFDAFAEYIRLTRI
jgi:hypothetical protein